MRGRKNPPLDLTPVPEGAPVTFTTFCALWRRGRSPETLRRSSRTQNDAECDR